MLFMLVILVFTFGSGIQAGEIVYTDDIRENVVDKEVLVKTADNVIVMVDSSSSMAAINKTYKKPYYELEKEALKAGQARRSMKNTFEAYESIVPSRPDLAAAA